jgi:hypothetical protein
MLIRRFSALGVTVAAVFLLGNWTSQGLAQAKQDQAKGERGGQGDVTLRIEGDQRVPFSGACTVGGERRKIAGQTPRSFQFDLKGRKLSCEIGKRGSQSGELEVVLSGENVHSVQRLAGAKGTVSLNYGGGGSFSSMSWSSQTVSGTAGSSSSGADDTVPGEDTLETLADRIERKVEDIFERAMP